MHYAVLSGKLECVRYIDENGGRASLAEKNGAGEDAVSIAIRHSMLKKEEGFPFAQIAHEIFYCQFFQSVLVKMSRQHYFDIAVMYVKHDNVSHLNDLLKKFNSHQALFSMIESMSLAKLHKLYIAVKFNSTPLTNKKTKTIYDNFYDSIIANKTQNHLMIDLLIYIGLHYNSNNIVKVLIQIKKDQGKDIDHPNLGELTTLQHAASFNRLEPVRLLLNLKANPNLLDPTNKFTAFQWALSTNAIEVAYELCQKKHYESSGKTFPQAAFELLVCAIKANKLSIFKTLYPRVKDKLPKDDNPNIENKSLLDYAIDAAVEFRDESLVFYLLEQGVNVNENADYEIQMDHKNKAELALVNRGQFFGKAVLPIHRAILRRLSYRCIQNIITKMKLVDADSLNISDNHGCSPLLLSILTGRSDIVDLLLSHGADPNKILSEHPFNPFENWDGLYKEILLKTSDTNKQIIAQFKPKRINGLIWAIDFDLNAIVHHLFAHKVNVKLIEESSPYLLDYAYDSKNQFVIDTLRKAGATCKPLPICSISIDLPYFNATNTIRLILTEEIPLDPSKTNASAIENDKSEKKNVLELEGVTKDAGNGDNGSNGDKNEATENAAGDKSDRKEAVENAIGDKGDKKEAVENASKNQDDKKEDAENVTQNKKDINKVSREKNEKTVVTYIDFPLTEFGVPPLLNLQNNLQSSVAGNILKRK